MGVRDLAQLTALQQLRMAANPPLRHQTRHAPKRGDELCAQGSIYWVIGGVVLARQRVLEIRPDVWEDGTKCCALVLDPVLVRVAARPVKAFQGWRYLAPAQAPADLTSQAPGAQMPEAMRQALAALALL